MQEVLAFLFWFLALLLFFSLVFTPGGALVLFLVGITLILFLPFIIFGLIFGVLLAAGPKDKEEE